MFSTLITFVPLVLAVVGASADSSRIRVVHNGVAQRARGELAKRVSGARWTFYDVGLGACGKTNVASDFIVALNANEFGSGYPGPNCFKQIQMNYNGKSAVATIMDECPGCPTGGLDLSRGLFQHFDSEDKGVIYGEWSFIDGSGAGSGATTTTKASAAATTSTKAAAAATSTKAAATATTSTKAAAAATTSPRVAAAAAATATTSPRASAAAASTSSRASAAASTSPRASAAATSTKSTVASTTPTTKARVITSTTKQAVTSAAAGVHAVASSASTRSSAASTTAAAVSSSSAASNSASADLSSTFSAAAPASTGSTTTSGTSTNATALIEANMQGINSLLTQLGDLFVSALAAKDN